MRPSSALALAIGTLLSGCLNETQWTEAAFPGEKVCVESEDPFEAIAVDPKYQGADGLVAGNIHQTIGAPSTSLSGFEFTSSTKAFIFLYCTNGLIDAPTTVVSKVKVDSISSWPIKFELSGDLNEVSKNSDCAIDVQVRKHGNRLCMGDLIYEFHRSLSLPALNLDVPVTGLESCRSADAGGFCF